VAAGIRRDSTLQTATRATDRFEIDWLDSIFRFMSGDYSNTRAPPTVKKVFLE